jgi:hypothetical protein
LGQAGFPTDTALAIEPSMITEEKIEEIRRRVRRGEPEGELKETLLREGYSQEEIDKAFAPPGYDMRSWYLVFGFVFLLGGLWAWATYGSLLGFGFSALLFIQYYRETERLKKERDRQS